MRVARSSFVSLFSLPPQFSTATIACFPHLILTGIHDALTIGVLTEKGVGYSLAREEVVSQRELSLPA
jgi:hypothetical protein